ncbi:hypothetical protein GCM10012280_26180 [Wenjunlia tyrosinilytica]|uniref:Uncharacterized protein n=1 Tax=Wenjunlia tyrosinilytica TaxID=1544741 RepID=A0A917ZP10_9ACTN|nr:hypothetical protein GCM10012280_26180 [Wenjunlia tyrosinilytica]
MAVCRTWSDTRSLSDAGCRSGREDVREAVGAFLGPVSAAESGKDRRGGAARPRGRGAMAATA